MWIRLTSWTAPVLGRAAAWRAGFDPAHWLWMDTLSKGGTSQLSVGQASADLLFDTQLPLFPSLRAHTHTHMHTQTHTHTWTDTFTKPLGRSPNLSYRRPTGLQEESHGVEKGEVNIYRTRWNISFFTFLTTKTRTHAHAHTWQVQQSSCTCRPINTLHLMALWFTATGRWEDIEWTWGVPEQRSLHTNPSGRPELPLQPHTKLWLCANTKLSQLTNNSLHLSGWRRAGTMQTGARGPDLRRLDALKRKPAALGNANSAKQNTC